MSKQDFYELLGVARDADEKTLKNAYRKLAMKFHPDRNPGDAAAEKKFKDLSEAYDILRDGEKRAAYDRYGHAAFEQGGPGAAGGAGAAGGFGGFADIFDEMFGNFGGVRGGRRSARQQGSDLRYNMAISLEDAYKGLKTTIRVPTAVPCGACHGSGAEGNKPPVTCEACRGVGRVRAQSGFFTVERTCPTCGGSGRVIKTPCRPCGGSGRVEREKNLSVSIPAGVEEGTRIRLAGEGEAGLRGNPPGDLYIFLSMHPHRLFEREGTNILCRVPVPMTTAALGGSIEVPAVDGARARITIPAGTQSGHQFRLKGKGMSILRSKARGDMFVRVEVEVPVKLTKHQRDLLVDFQKACDEKGDHHNPESAGFFKKVKEVWDDLTE